MASRRNLSFNDAVDKWFDLVADNPQLGDTRVMRLDVISQRAPSKRNFDEFYDAALARTPDVWGRSIRMMCLWMDRGDFDDEFQRFAGTKRQLSQVKEFFRAFQQALHYG